MIKLVYYAAMVCTLGYIAASVILFYKVHEKQDEFSLKAVFERLCSYEVYPYAIFNGNKKD